MASKQQNDRREQYSQEQTLMETGYSVEQAKESNRSITGESPSAYVENETDPVENFYEEFAAEEAPASNGKRPREEEPLGLDADFNEEFAEETVPAPRDTAAVRTAENDDVTMADKPYIGWIALVLAIASLFVWPVVLGPAGALLGLAAWSQGSRGLGVWSIVLGVISFLSYLVLVPLYS
jgi:hypothetical protein